MNIRLGNMPLIHAQNKGRAILIGYLLFSLLYLSSGNFHFYQPKRLSLTIIDEYIPFMPWSIIIYLSQLLFLFLALWKAENLKRTKTYYAMLFAVFVASIVFFVMPTELPRQVIKFQGFIAYLWHFLYVTDPAANCFPSLHVALSVLAANALFTLNRFWFCIAPTWAFLICFSTLTTKQHQAIDILGGALLACLSIFVVNFLLSKTINEITYKSD